MKCWPGFPPFYNDNHMKLYDNIVNTNAIPASFDPIAKDLVLRLLEKNPAKRLGVQTGSISDIKNHIWFKDVKWDALYACSIRAPYKPKIASDGDCSNFDLTRRKRRKKLSRLKAVQLEIILLKRCVNYFPILSRNKVEIY